MIEIKGVPGLIEYRRDDKMLRVVASDSLLCILEIKEFDNGYVVFNAKYQHGVEEEYLDLEEVLLSLGIEDQKDEYFNEIRREDICIKR